MTSSPRPRFWSAGFGAIELVVVVVILGAIFTLTLNGTKLIAPLRARVVAQQIDRYQSAMMSYIADHRALPGDDAGAPARFQRNESLYQIDGALVTFVGDGKINGLLDDAAAASGEQFLAWSDLRAGGYVEGDRKLVGQSARPENTYGGVFAFAEDNLGLEQVMFLTRVPGNDAQILDTNIDDGKISTGNVRGTSKWDPVEAKNHFAAPDSAPYDPEKTYIICLPYVP